MTIQPFDRPTPTGPATASTRASVAPNRPAAGFGTTPATAVHLGNSPPSAARVGAYRHADAVVCATPTVLAAVADLTALYVARQPWACRLIADDDQRRRSVELLTSVLAAYALAHGNVDLIGRRSAAIWLDRTIAQPAVAPIYRRLLATCGPDITPLTDALTAATRRQASGPHLYLAVLAPASREDALALLAHRHRRLDRAGVTARAAPRTPGEATVLAVAGYQIDGTLPVTGGIGMRRLPAGRRHDAQPRIWPPDAG